MDPFTLMLLGTAANIGGGILSRHDVLANAQREAQARNQILAQKIGAMEGDYNTYNKPAFDTLMGNYAPATQAANLSNAQTARSNTNVGNISNDNVSSIPIGEGVAPAVQKAYADKMKEAMDYSTNYARANGRLGGYTDAWFANNLANQEAQRQVNYGNSLAEGQKALVQPEQDAAAAASYRQPSILGPALQGAGSLMAMYGGANLGGPMSSPDYHSFYNPFTSFNPSGG